MKINFLGDSITEGCWASSKEKRYTSLVCKMLGATENNYGIGGTRIAKQKQRSNDSEDNDFCSRAQKMDKDADFVFVFGGTNDYGHGDADIGDINDNGKDTFCGALKWLVEYLINIYGKSCICFILPLHRYNENNPYGEGAKQRVGGTLSQYVQAEIDILKFYEIDFLDFRDIFPIPKVNTGDELTHDGLHPNNEGHLLLAEKIVEYINSKK